MLMFYLGGLFTLILIGYVLSVDDPNDLEQWASVILTGVLWPIVLVYYFMKKVEEDLWRK